MPASSRPLVLRSRCMGGTTYWPLAWAWRGVSTGSAGSICSTFLARAAARRAWSRVWATTANTGCPRKRISPSHRMGSSGTAEPQSLTPGMSSPVMTLTTPAIARTASRSMPSRRPAATGDRPSAQCSVPASSGMSSV